MTTTTLRVLDDPLKEAIRKAFTSLRESLPGFQPRRSQNLMIGVASRALGTPGGRAIVEAPTGTGKSMAYLTPALPIALAHNRKVVISTATIALQEQVFTRDMPNFLKATGLTAKVALAKGRNRYACPARMLDLTTHRQSGQEAMFEDMEVAAWTRPPQQGEGQTVETLFKALDQGRWDGDLDNTPMPVADDLKTQMTVPKGACTGRRCAFYRQCPAQKARNAVKAADIIISNHDLTIASLKQAQMGEDEMGNFLAEPASTLYVFDEGHTLSRIAVDRSAESVNLPATLQQVGKLRKLVAASYRVTGEAQIGGVPLSEAHANLERYAAALRDIQRVLQDEWQPDPSERDPQWRAPKGQIPAHWQQLAQECRSTCFDVFAWFSRATTAAAEMEGNAEAKDRLLKQLGMTIEVIEANLDLWRRWGAVEDGTLPVARWMSSGRDGAVVCHASAISAAPFLKEALWDVADSVLLTSATLSEGGDFRLLVEQLGAPENTEIVSLPSPFDLEKQARLSVPRFPVTPNDPKFPGAVAEWLGAGLDWEAGSLVLFTSRKKMQETADLLPPTLRAKVRVQGETSKQVMLQEHAAAIGRGEGAVLFGLLSLGEGLDLPGKLLTHVVCTQVPFAVPTDPVGATLAEWIEHEGGNAFFDLALPAATRTLTQFTGRLIRTEADRGTVTILDNRLIHKRYGRTILDALPPFRRDIAR